MASETRPSSVSPQPRCAVHPAAEAALTCERCGNFACADCAVLDSGLCRTCVDTLYTAMRQKYGPHERHVRTVAVLLWMTIAAAMLTLAGVARDASRWPIMHNALILGSVVTLPLCISAAVAAYHIRKLMPVGQRLGCVVALPMLLVFPLGTLLGSYVLWSLLSNNGRKVFSKDYRMAAALTPELVFGVPRGTQVVLALVCLAGSLQLLAGWLR